MEFAQLATGRSYEPEIERSSFNPLTTRANSFKQAKPDKDTCRVCTVWGLSPAALTTSSRYLSTMAAPSPIRSPKHQQTPTGCQ